MPPVGRRALNRRTGCSTDRPFPLGPDRAPRGATLDPMSARASSAASSNTLGLLDVAQTFTQLGALTESQFEREATLRATPLGFGLGERLHRDGILVPLYGIEYDAGLLRDRARMRGEPLEPVA